MEAKLASVPDWKKPAMMEKLAKETEEKKQAIASTLVSVSGVSGEW